SVRRGRSHRSMFGPRATARDSRAPQKNPSTEHELHGHFRKKILLSAFAGGVGAITVAVLGGTCGALRGRLGLPLSVVNGARQGRGYWAGCSEEMPCRPKSSWSEHQQCGA